MKTGLLTLLTVTLMIVISVYCFYQDMKKYHASTIDEVIDEVVEQPIITDTPQKLKIEPQSTIVPTNINSPTNTKTFLVTAYCPCEKCCGKSDGITATGVKATAGRTIAVDPRVIPYGTKVEIEGLGVRVAEDCGGAVKGNNRIDLYFDSHQEAIEFGVQNLKVVILDE